MPSDHTMDDHIHKSEHDFEVANLLSENPRYCDWGLVCVFYSMIHCIDAYAHKIRREKELMPSSIGEKKGGWYELRRKFMKKYLNKFYGLYDRLYNKSRECRYNPKYYQLMPKNPIYRKKLFESVEKFRATVQ